MGISLCWASYFFYSHSVCIGLTMNQSIHLPSKKRSRLARNQQCKGHEKLLLTRYSSSFHPALLVFFSHFGRSPVPELERKITRLVPPALPSSPKYFCLSSLVFSALACLARSIMPSTHFAFCSGKADFFPLEGPASPTSPGPCLLGGRDPFAVEGRELPDDDLGVVAKVGVCLPVGFGVDLPLDRTGKDQS